MNMDMIHKHTNPSRFMLLNNINHFSSSPESTDLMPIKMVWNDQKFYVVNNGNLKIKIF